MLSYETWREFAQARRSSRDFLPNPISPETLESVLNDGITSPSWSNTRPFQIAVAQGEQRDRISAALVKRLQESKDIPGNNANPDFTHETPYPAELAARSTRVGVGLYELLGIDRSDKAARFSFLQRNYEFFGAPTAIFFFTHRGLDRFGTLDLGFYMQSVMLAAQANGLGTCAQGFLGHYPDIIRAEFDVSDDYALVCGMSVGYPSDHPINTWKAERLPVQELLLSPRS